MKLKTKIKNYNKKQVYHHGKTKDKMKRKCQNQELLQNILLKLNILLQLKILQIKKESKMRQK